MILSLYNLENLENVLKITAGDNPQGVSVVYDASSETKESQIFLEKVFSAVSKDFNNLDKFSVVKDANASLVQWSGWSNLEILIFFGINPAKLGIHYPLQPFVPMTVDGRKFLSCPDLTSIQSTSSHKKALWVALQNLFEING